MRKYVSILIIIFVFGFFASNAYAQIMIEQGKIVIKANPGETIVNTLSIHNTSATATNNLRVYWEDFSYVEPFDGTKEFTAAGTIEYSASRWINFSPQQFTIGPKSTKLVSYSIRVPDDAKGGYYGVLFFEEGSGKSGGEVAISLVTRIGALFFIETTNSTYKGKVENLKFVDKQFSGDFINLGDVVLIPDATYYILDKDGVVADRGEIKKFYLAPKKTVSFKVPVSEKLIAGDYTAVLTFDFGSGENVTQEFDFHKADDNAVSITKVAS